ncbi:hypothetical protein [Wielerella bovis]|uniref:hypothetical protein n=1 Tax=Wielerella bovis TaxID=2917790 RepID=UPI00201955E6|nr:hypothetical protein [Wielerella bovis]ULJ64019.1 hypothetical protein MIS33_07565 [Wielerella bovis]ULJ67520.1 hypothetical protein MIS31_02890 [Wielerella bovis]
MKQKAVVILNRTVKERAIVLLDSSGQVEEILDVIEEIESDIHDCTFLEELP